MTANPEFRPCPFCGEADIRCDQHRSDDSPTGMVWSMCCYNCGATFPNRYKRELLVEAWNRRAANAVATSDNRDPQPSTPRD